MRKFRTLADGVLAPDETERFLDLAQRLPELGADELAGLTVTPADDPAARAAVVPGIF